MVVKKGRGKTHTPEIKQYKQELGNRIKQIRHRVYGENQTKLSKRLEIPQSHFSNIENGNTFPTIPLLNKIIKISGVRWSWLMTGEGDMLEEDNKEEENEILTRKLNDCEKRLKAVQDTKSKQDKIIENQNVLIDMLKRSR